MSLGQSGRRHIAVALWAAAVAALILWRGVPFERAQLLAIILAGLSSVSVGATGETARLLRDWLPVAALLAAYDYTRGAADVLGQPVLVRWPADADATLFGRVPTVWFQQRYGAGAAWYSVTSSLLYASHFVLPLAIGALLWWRHPELWVRWRRRLLTVTTMALGVFLLMPVAPPWVASRVGVIGPARRTANEGWHALGLSVADNIIGHGQATTNLYAAMPSLHAAFALIGIVAVWPLLTAAGRVVAAAYPAAMGVVLVTTGEHYVVDVIAGFLLVGVVDVAWRRSEGSNPIAVERVPAPSRHLAPWVGPIAVPALVAAATRLPLLGVPRVLTYDEVFYVNDAIDLAVSGNQPGALHPPFSKWLMAPAIRVLGVNPIAWRLPVLLAGIVIVAAVGAAAWLVTGRRRLAALAALLCGFDGLAFVTGRLGLLEAGATLCVAVIAVALLAVHRPGGWAETGAHRWAPLAATAGAGVAVAAKWSLAPAAAVALASLVGPLRQQLRMPLIAALVVLLAGFLAAMVLAWGPASRPVNRPALLAPPLSTLDGIAAQSARMAEFHRGLDRSGPGHAPAWTWTTQSSPILLYVKECRGRPGLTDGVCPPGRPGEARIMAQGNPVLWISGTVALTVLVWRACRSRSRTTLVTVTLAASLWLPWLLPGARPYSFYGAVVVPVLALAVAQVLAESRWASPLSVALGATAVGWFILHYPELTALS